MHSCRVICCWLCSFKKPSWLYMAQVSPTRLGSRVSAVNLETAPNKKLI